MSDFEGVVPELAKAYDDWKEAGTEKDLAKDKFYELANEAIVERGLATKAVVIDAPAEGLALRRARQHNPGWNVQSLRRESPGTYAVVLIEDQALQAFSYEHEGRKVSRQVSRGSVLIDEEWLAEADPELLTKVTVKLPWGVLVPRPLESLDHQTIAALTSYLYNDKPRMSLSVRAVKSDE